MQQLSGHYLHAEVRGRRFAIYFDYDPHQQKEKSRVLLPEGIEMHYRIPIDPDDVDRATADNGLEMDDYSSDPIIPGRWFVGLACYFVLSKR
jgi:hypothetical protein